MMNSINLMGRLTKDPEVTTIQSGTEKAEFCIACTRDTKPQNADTYGTDFINCIVWGKRASFVRDYFFKGQLCGLTGRLEISNFKDKDGNWRNYTQVNVASIYFAERKDSGSQSTAQASNFEPPAMQPGAFVALEDDDSDLPF